MADKFRKLNADEIEVRVKQVSEKGATALLYKTARTDMDILDETVGADGWSCRYDEIHDNLFCTITIGDVSKQNCGIESKQDDGNEKKAEASDAFKRAGFCWGIGRELYTAPFIWLKVKTEKNSKGNWIVSNYATFSVKSIEYDGIRISGLTIIDDKTGTVVYTFKQSSSKQTREEPDEEPNETLKPERTEEDSAIVSDAIDKAKIEILQIAQAAGRDEAAVARFAEKLILDNFNRTVKYEDMHLGFLITVKNALVKRIDAENAK